MDSKAKMRVASHAGSWYSGQGAVLNKELNNWLNLANQDIQGISLVKAIIGP